MPLTTKRVSAIVACYRDADSIRAMYQRLTAALRTVTPHYRIIYVNDASPDNAGAILDTLAREDPRVTVVTHSRNFGSQMAFTSGMAAADADAVVLLDGDLQDPPELIPAFVEQWLQGYEVVYGIRVARRGEPLIRKIGYRLFYRLFQRLADVQVPLEAGDFSLMDRKIAELLVAMPERDRFLRGLRAWVGFSQIGVPYERGERYAGSSTNSFLANFRWARRGIANFSTKPLEYVAYLAISVAALSAIAIVGYIVIAVCSPNTPKGFLTLLVMILFLGSVQLLSLAVIGDYVGRVLEEVKQRPRFIVKEVLNPPQR